MVDELNENTITAPSGDPEANAKAAVDAFFAGKKGAAPAVAPTPTPAPTPRPGADVRARVESKPAPRGEPEPQQTIGSPDAYEAQLRAIVGADYDTPLTKKLSDEAAMSALRGVWGPDTEAKLEVVQALTAKLGDGFRAMLDATGRGQDPLTIQRLYEYALANEQEPASASYTLELPPMPAIAEEGWAPVLERFAAVASETGMSAAVAQDFVEAVTDAEAIFNHEAPSDESIVPDSEQAWSIVRATFGETLGAEIVRSAHRAAKQRGASFLQGLDETGMGNRPSVLLALALENDMRLRPEQAQKALDALMNDRKGPYHSRDTGQRKYAVARVGVLSRIAGRGEAPAKGAPPAWAPPKPSAQETASSSARAEAARILSETNNFTKGTAQENAALKAKFLELTARI